MTMDDLRKNLERQILIEQVQRQEVGSKLNITEEEARQYYLAHQERIHRPAIDHAARNLRRGADDVQGGQTALNVGQGRRGAEEDRRGARAHARG